MKLFIVVPAFNEEKVLNSVLKNLKKVKVKNFIKEIVVIDDGSTDKTGEIAKKLNVTTICHPINRGLGGALGTGIEYARSKKADIVITFDADGQHRYEDINRLLKPIITGKADVVIGSRLLKNSKMPVDRKILNIFANILNYILWSTWITDSQSGLRALSKNAIEKIQVKMNRMEVASEFFKEIKKNHLIVKEIPIKAIYSSYSREKGQKNSNSFNVILKLLLYKFESLR
jgi:glycosyltransferase involved in cell wall biosynthesis